MSFDTIRTEIRGTTGLITLDRPDVLNALNNQVCRELTACLAEFEANDKVDCAIITGSEKAFAAGADIKEMAELDFVASVFPDLPVSDFLWLHHYRQPDSCTIQQQARRGCSQQTR